MENSKEQGKKKIKEEDLGTVSGGCGKKKPDPHKDKRYITEMECSKCRFGTRWIGNYCDDIKYPCPKCGNLFFRGTRLYEIPL